MTIEHLAAQWCADRANENRAERGCESFSWKRTDFINCGDVSSSFRQASIKWHEAAVDVLKRAPHVSDEVKAILDPFILREPAPTDPKDARIAELEVELAEERDNAERLRAMHKQNAVHTAAWNKDEPTDAGVDQTVCDLPSILSEEECLKQLALLYNYRQDDSRQFTRWNMLVAIAHGAEQGSIALRSRPKVRKLTEEDVCNSALPFAHFPKNVLWEVTQRLNERLGL